METDFTAQIRTSVFSAHITAILWKRLYDHVNSVFESTQYNLISDMLEFRGYFQMYLQ